MPYGTSSSWKRHDHARCQIRRGYRIAHDAALQPEIEWVFDENWRVYGVGKVWRQLDRECFDVARCKVARLI
jgi:hypothetical protein